MDDGDTVLSRRRRCDTRALHFKLTNPITGRITRLIFVICEVSHDPIYFSVA